MTHPLTDDIIWSMSSEGDRSALAEEKLARRAADWQLEQVIEQWEEVVDSTMTDIQVIREFDKRLKAMRPQQQEDDQ